jgi:hypothetical protein
MRRATERLERVWVLRGKERRKGRRWEMGDYILVKREEQLWGLSIVDLQLGERMLLL